MGRWERHPIYRQHVSPGLPTTQSEISIQRSLRTKLLDIFQVHSLSAQRATVTGQYIDPYLMGHSSVTTRSAVYHQMTFASNLEADQLTLRWRNCLFRAKNYTVPIFNRVIAAKTEKGNICSSPC